MSQPRPSSLGLEALGGGLMVTACWIVLARWLPLEFSYRPNSLGILSVTTALRYPTQQESILFLGFGATGVLAVWLASGWLDRRHLALPALAGFQLTALGALLAALMLPAGLAAGVVAALFAALVFIVRRGDTETARDDATAETPPDDAGLGPLPYWALALSVAALALLRVPRLAQAVTALGVPDSKLTRNAWVFLSEDGQHLAWADALANGGFHGKDIFCLYGPLYDWSVVWMWKLFGRSVAAWHVHVGVTEVLAWVAFLAVASLVLRRRWLLLPLVLFVPHLTLRVGLGFASLAFLFRHGRDGRRGDAFAAGLFGGAALLYSQEFGAAALLCAAVLFSVRTSLPAIAAYAGATLLAVTPMLLYYASADALAPMLGDLVGYPGLLMAGFGNLPFPSLTASLPWALAPGGVETRLLREFYFLPAILVVALGVCLPRVAPHPRSPFIWLARLRADWAANPRRLELALVALFGLAVYRSALGRSDQMHLYAVAAPSILLLAAGADHLLGLARRRPAAVALQLALGSALIWFGGLATGTAGAGAFHLTNAARTAEALARGGTTHRGDGSVNRVVAWLAAKSESEDAFYFMPNDAALYYLTGRASPTRFVVSHQMVTNAHRAEALADLQAAPPRYVVWNDASLRLDDIGDEAILGPAFWAWLHENYRSTARIGGMDIWEWAPGEATPTPKP